MRFISSRVFLLFSKDICEHRYLIFPDGKTVMLRFHYQSSIARREDFLYLHPTSLREECIMPIGNGCSNNSLH
jgi:hypothetical protein